MIRRFFEHFLCQYFFLTCQKIKIRTKEFSQKEKSTGMASKTLESVQKIVNKDKKYRFYFG